MAPTWEDTVWGSWRLRNKRMVRPGEINGHAEYWQLDDEHGDILDKQGNLLSDSQKRQLLNITPRHAPMTTQSDRRSSVSEQQNQNYGLVSTSNVNRHISYGPRSSNPGLPQYATNIAATAFPEFQRQALPLGPQPLFPTDSAEAVSTDQGRSAYEHDDSRDASDVQKTIMVNGQKIPLISADAAHPDGAKNPVKRNGRTYFYDRQNALIAVAESTGTGQPRSKDLNDVTKGMNRLDVQDEQRQGVPTRLQPQQPPIVTHAGRKPTSTSRNSTSTRKDRQLETRTDAKEERHASNQSGPQRKGSNKAKLPPISEQRVLGPNERAISGDGRGQEEDLDERYQVRRSVFFHKGRVFAMLWHESDTSTRASDAGEQAEHQYSIGRFNQRIYTTVRRMVVVKEAKGYCLCSPILTYGNKGLNKDGIPDSEVKKHAAVYMNNTSPIIDVGERLRGMDKESIAVQPARADQKLLPMSRLNFGKIFCVEHNVKVMDVGTVLGDHLRKLQTYHYNTFA